MLRPLCVGSGTTGRSKSAPLRNSAVNTRNIAANSGVFPSLGKTPVNFFQGLEKTTDSVSKVWKTLAAIPLPGGNYGVEIWLADLATLAPEEDLLSSLLNDTEHEEIHRLHHACDRQKMVLRRGVRRVVLGRYLACPPELLRFERAEHGKPRVPGISFSASSSHQTMLLVVARGAEVGADIEDASAFQFAPALAGTCCSRAERDRITALPEAYRAAEFLRLWTAKEAVLKLRGIGFREQMDLPGLLEKLRAGERVVELPLAPPLVASLAVAPLTPA